MNKNKLVSRFFLRQRQGKGIKIIPLGAGIKKVFAALKNNEAVGVLADIDYLNPQAGIHVNFFGRPAIMPKGPAAFALKTACPVVPVFLLREKRDTFFSLPFFFGERGLIHCLPPTENTARSD